MKYRNKIASVRIILLTIAAILMGLSIYSWNAKTLLGNKLPMAFGIGASVVMSGSMEPELGINDLVIIKETNDYEVGDIIVFQNENMLIIHRIAEINGDEITTKGDANNVSDAPIELKDVKGELVWNMKGIGLLVQFFKNPMVIILVLVIAVSFTEQSFRKEKEEDAYEIKALMEEIKRLRDN